MELKKILFFKPGAIGDLLHALPAVKAFRRKFPAAHIDLMVSPATDSLIQGTGIADRVLVFDKSRFKAHWRDLIGFGRKLKSERYDVFVDLQPSFRSLVLRRLSGAARVLVYRKQKRRGPGAQRQHATDNFMDTLRPLGVAAPVTRIELPVKDDALRAVERLLDERAVDRSRPIIALNCGASAARPARNWFPERFAELADRLRDEGGATVVFVGGDEDRDLVQRVLTKMHGTAVSLAGELRLDETAALLSRCACLVSSDTGPLHLATAVQTPVVGLFGSTDPLRTGPVGDGHRVIVKDLACVPCEEKTCPLGTRACMAAITVDEVLAAVRKVTGAE